MYTNNYEPIQSSALQPTSCLYCQLNAPCGRLTHVSQGTCPRSRHPLAGGLTHPPFTSKNSGTDLQSVCHTWHLSRCIPPVSTTPSPSRLPTLVLPFLTHLPALKLAPLSVQFEAKQDPEFSGTCRGPRPGPPPSAQPPAAHPTSSVLRWLTAALPDIPNTSLLSPFMPALKCPPRRALSYHSV